MQTFKWKSNNRPVDLTGCVARLQLRTNNAAESVALSISTETNELVVEGVNGVIKLRVEASVMKTIAAGTYNADLEVTFPDVNATVISTPTFLVEIIKDVTRSG